MNTQQLIEEALKEFDEIGFGDQIRIPGGRYGAKRVELKQFIRDKIATATQQAVEEERDSLNKTKVWIVMYRGNGYGAFLNKDIAIEFGEFIAQRNETKYGKPSNVGKYEPHLYEYGLIEAIDSARPYCQALSKKGSDGK